MSLRSSDISLSSSSRSGKPLSLVHSFSFRGLPFRSLQQWNWWRKIFRWPSGRWESQCIHSFAAFRWRSARCSAAGSAASLVFAVPAVLITAGRAALRHSSYGSGKKTACVSRLEEQCFWDLSRSFFSSSSLNRERRKNEPKEIP